MAAGRSVVRLGLRKELETWALEMQVGKYTRAPGVRGAEAASQDPDSKYKSRRHREILGAWVKRDFIIGARAP